jgi:hypothetical protein
MPDLRNGLQHVMYLALSSRRQYGAPSHAWYSARDCRSGRLTNRKRSGNGPSRSVQRPCGVINRALPACGLLHVSVYVLSSVL